MEIKEERREDVVVLALAGELMGGDESKDSTMWFLNSYRMEPLTLWWT